jgi:DNA-binding transcriptional regulator LsrR (DeoR family)
MLESSVPGLPPGADGVPSDQVRLLTRVARMYHERGIRQPQIAQQLHISQPRVSRLLKRAAEVGIVRTAVVSPRGVHAELEERIEQQYGLTEVVVADTEALTDEHQVQRAIGAAASVYLGATLMGGERIGVSSWSSTLLATVEAMHPRPTPVADQVVQMLGGLGNVNAQTQATRITGGLAQVLGATAVFLPAPGLLGSGDARAMFLTDPNIAPVLDACSDLTMALVGIGSVEPSPLLRESGNAFDESQLPALVKAGAVGDVCLRFFNAHGAPVATALDQRVLGISAEALRRVPRRVGVAGTARKFTAIRAALVGGWVNILVTDLQVAQRLVSAETVVNTSGTG